MHPRLKLNLKMRAAQSFNRILLWASLYLLKGPINPLNSPIGAKVEITNRCNLACKMCLHKSLEEKGDMSLKIYEKIISQLPESVTWINLTGFGEPLLHNEINEIVRVTRSKHKHPEIYTNATLLDTAISKTLLSSKPASIHFSIDGATKKTYEFLRLGAKFDDIIQNIKTFMVIRSNFRSRPHVAMRVVVVKENVHEASKFIDLARELDIKDVRFQALQLFQDHDFSTPEHSIHHLKELDRVKQTFRSAQEKAKKSGIKLRLPKMDFTPEISCTQPWYLTCINWKGQVYPCAVEYDVLVGDMLTQHFKDIWKGAELRKWRKAMKGLSPPIQCTICFDR